MPVFPGGPIYKDVVEEYCARYVFPKELSYKGVGVTRDNVICEEVSRDGNSWWVTCRARYSGRVVGQKIGAERVRVRYDNGHVSSDLGGLKGVIDTKSISNWLDKNKILSWSRDSYSDENSTSLFFDAIVEHPLKKNLYFFRDDRYYIFSIGKDEFVTEKMTGQDGWRGLPGGIDLRAALMHPNGKAYFFDDNNYYRFDFDRELSRKDKNGVDRTGVIGETGWRGLPKNHINAALMHPDGTAHFFAGDKFYVFDFKREKNRKDKNGVVRTGIVGKDNQYWQGVDPHGITGAVLHTVKGETFAYFFTGASYQKYSFSAKKVIKEGKVGKKNWKGLNDE